MRRVQRSGDFVRQPVGRFVAGRSYLAWCASEDLGGTVLWGAPSLSEVDELTRLWEYDRALPGRFDVVSDLSRVTAVDTAAFERLSAYVGARATDYDARVRRHALVRPRGLSGAAVAGFNLMLAPRFEWRVGETLTGAFAWLARADGAAVCAEVEARVAEVAGVELTLSALRALLAENLRLDIDAAAATLGVSVRSLQRHLSELATSFRDEVAKARAVAARRLIDAGGEKLDVVAGRVGLASASQLARLLRRLDSRKP